MSNSVRSRSQQLISELDAHKIVKRSLRTNGKRMKRSKKKISLNKCEMEQLMMGKCPASMNRKEIVFWFAQLVFMTTIENNLGNESKDFIIWIRSHIYKMNFDVAVNLISSIPIFQMKRMLLDFDVCNAVRTKRIVCDHNKKALAKKNVPLVDAENSEFDRMLRNAVFNFSDGDKKIVKKTFHLRNADGSIFGK